MLRKYAGGLIGLGLAASVAAVLVLNLETPSTAPPAGPKRGAEPAGVGNAPPPAGFREFPIGDEFETQGLRVAAVWLPAIHMAGMGPAAADPSIIHLEADIHALAGNPNGFAKDEFVPYLKVDYRITDDQGQPQGEGTLSPMVARDGLHYGASIRMPRAGKFRLVYRISPPSSDLGRHDDPVTGVAPWWEPFEASFDWDYAGPPAPAAAGDAR